MIMGVGLVKIQKVLEKGDVEMSLQPEKLKAFDSLVSRENGLEKEN